MTTDPRFLRGEFFVAAMPPPDIAQTLHDSFGQHRNIKDDFDWKSPQHFHVTLAIAGDISLASLPTMTAILKEVKTGAFTATINTTGHFLKNINNRANRHVLWAGFDKKSHRAFETLRSQLRDSFKKHHMRDYQTAFQPHITIARPQNPLRETVKNVVEQGTDLTTIPEWNVTHISLLQRLPRPWQKSMNLAERFHEIARYDLTTGEVTHTNHPLVRDGKGGVRYDKTYDGLSVFSLARCRKNPLLIV